MTHNLKGITLHSALRLILGQFDLTYVVVDDALVITTAEESQRLVGQGAIGESEVKRALENGPLFPSRHKRLASALQEASRAQFFATAPQDVVDFVKNQYDIPIEIDPRASVPAGVRPLTLDMRNVTLEVVLQKLVRDLGLTYVVDDEYILITAPKKDGPAEKNDQGK